MLKLLQAMPMPLLLLVASVLEAGGDAVVRVALYQHAGVARAAWLMAGAAVLLSYATLLNLAPIEFGRVVGLYIATLFVVWQAINFLAFRSVPDLPVWLGGTFIIAGGLIVTFWRAA